jgi:hypothetical protein
MRRSSQLLALAALLAAPLAPSNAQQIAPAMLPFHQGQWAVEFSGRQLDTFGFMRFFSPRTALVLGISGSVDTRNSSQTNTSAPTTDSKLRSHSIDLSVGLRRHSSLGGNAVGSIEGGLTGRHSAGRATSGATTYSTDHSFGYGMYGSAGAQYLFTSHVAVGASLRLTAAQYRSSTRTVAYRAKDTFTYVSTALQPIRVTLYF